MTHPKIIVILIFCLVQSSFSQTRSRADRFFEKGDYLNAAQQYEQELNQEGYSKHILQNISTSYYNIFQFRKAYRYLKTLTAGKFYAKDKSYDNIYNFMTYQVLSALGEYEKSLIYLELYQKNDNQIQLNKSEAISTIESFKLKDDDYTISSVTYNSTSSEFGAIKKDSVVYFTSDRSPNGILDKKYKWTHRPFLNIYQLQTNSEVISLPGDVNSNLHEGNFCFSKDGNTMYLSKSNTEKGKKKFDSIKNNAIHLYKTQRIEGEWITPEKLDFNDVNYSIEHPSLSLDGKRLYFASNMPGGQGDFDIYYVLVNTDGTYSAPVNLGADINTAQREQFPYISPEGHLFFSSNGHLGLGMLDIFVAELKEDKLSLPINLGAPINSKYDDFSLNYYNKTQGFFASNRKNTNDDIYAFDQIGEIFPREYSARFEVKDFSSEKYIPNASVILYDQKDRILYESQLDSIASFQKKLYPGKYDFKASADGYKTRTKPVLIKEKEDGIYVIYLDRKNPSNNDNPTKTNTSDSTDITEKSKTTEEIYTKKRKETLTKTEIREALLKDREGPPVVEKDGKLFFDLPPIYFDYDKWNIRADSKKVLDEFALKLEKYKTVYIRISSHTDSRGTDSYNQVLSEKRAESTRNYLALVGYVNARRMKFEGFGESQPLIDCDSKVCTEAEHQINRRSEFEITQY